MSDPEPIDKIIKKIKKKYDKDSENWSVNSSIDKDGNKEMLISQQPNSYLLKMRALTAKTNMSYGKELKNLDEEINKEIESHTPKNSKKINNKEELLQLFGMMVPINPKKKDVIYMSGIEHISSNRMNQQKLKIDEKESNADKLFRYYLRKRWEREQALRNSMYL